MEFTDRSDSTNPPAPSAPKYRRFVAGGVAICLRDPFCVAGFNATKLSSEKAEFHLLVRFWSREQRERQREQEEAQQSKRTQRDRHGDRDRDGQRLRRCFADKERARDRRVESKSCTPCLANRPSIAACSEQANSSTKQHTLRALPQTTTVQHTPALAGAQNNKQIPRRQWFRRYTQPSRFVPPHTHSHP